MGRRRVASGGMDRTAALWDTVFFQIRYAESFRENKKIQ
jgi:hypothetical protein